MNVDELKFIFQYFDVHQFLAQNSPMKLAIILGGLIVLIIAAHFISKLIERKIMEHARNAHAAKGASKTEAQETLDSMDFDKFKKVMGYGRGLLYLFILGWSLKQLNVGPVYSEVMSMALTTVGTFVALLFVTAMAPFNIDLYLRRRGTTLQTSQIRSLMPIIQGLIWAVGLTFLLDNVGFHVSTIIAGLGIVGVAVGLAGQAILSDFFSYIVILLDKPFRMGDWIVLSNGKAGEVVYMGPKNTRLRNIEDNLIVCANSELTKNMLVNEGNVKERECALTIGVSYSMDMPTVRRVPAIMRDVISKFPQCSFERCCLMELGTANFLFQLIYHVHSAPGEILSFVETRSQVTLAVQQRLDDEKIVGAYPTEHVLVSNLPQ